MAAADDDASIVIEAAPAAIRVARHPPSRRRRTTPGGRTREAPTTRAARSRRRGHGPARAPGPGSPGSRMIDRSSTACTSGLIANATPSSVAAVGWVPVQFGEEGRGRRRRTERPPSRAAPGPRRRDARGAVSPSVRETRTRAIGRSASACCEPIDGRAASGRRASASSMGRAAGPTSRGRASAATSGTWTCCAPSIGSDVTLIPIGGATVRSDRPRRRSVHRDAVACAARAPLSRSINALPTCSPALIVRGFERSSGVGYVLKEPSVQFRWSSSSNRSPSR